ncbi:hypothetical protein AV521_01800 [Streptomyces sp. IMTB 2501]|nr:hypothetical protein AV521_01800 [Streptomyces sp. IMTB 2501]
MRILGPPRPGVDAARTNLVVAVPAFGGGIVVSLMQTLVAGIGVTRVEAELRPGAQVRGSVRGGGRIARRLPGDPAGRCGQRRRHNHHRDDGAYAFSDVDGGPYMLIAAGYPPRAPGVSVYGTDVEHHESELAYPGA